MFNYLCLCRTNMNYIYLLQKLVSPRFSYRYRCTKIYLSCSKQKNRTYTLLTNFYLFAKNIISLRFRLVFYVLFLHFLILVCYEQYVGGAFPNTARGKGEEEVDSWDLDR